MAYDQTFAPAYGTGSVNITISTSAQIAIPQGTKSLVLTNLGSVTIYVRVGFDPTTASVADYPILSGCQASISKDIQHDVIAFVSPEGSSSLHVMLGEGY